LARVSPVIENICSGRIEISGPISVFHLLSEGFRQDFPDYSTYKIKVDLLGLVERNGQYELIFIEVKDGDLNFSHLAQLLVYSKLVRPAQAILISPQGLSTHLNDIVNKYHRLDMLEYIPNRKIQLSKWDKHRGAIFL